MRNFEQLPPIPAGERQGEKKEELTPEELEGMEKIGPEEELTDEDLRFMKAIGPEEQPDLTEKELGEMEPILARENLTPEGLTEEIGNKPEKEKRSLFKGICNLGFITQELKSKFFAKALEGAGKIVDTDKGKQVQEKNTAARFFHAYSEIYKKQAKQSRDQIESGGKGFLSKSFKGGKNIGYLTGNIFRYGRILYDLNYANPFRHVMIASMFLGRSSEAAKEARFKNEKLIGKTRIEDAEKAEEEAWAIYEQAKEKGGDKVSAENLEKTYNKNISKDVLDRLAKKPEGVSHNIVQGFANRCLEWSAKRMNDKIEKINNSEIPEKEKEAKIDRIIKRKENLLKDLDRMVTQAGTVDLIAFGARGLEKTGKAVSTAMLIQTIYKLPEMLSNIAKTIEDDDRDIGKIVSGFFVSRAEAAETETGILSPDEKIAEAVGKAKGIQGLKQMVAEKFGLNVEDLKDVTGDKDVGDVDIAQIQSGKLGIPAISEPLSAENFRMAQELQEKAPSLIGKIFTDGKISEVESNILKSGWPDNIKLALLDDPADFANIQKIAESNPEIFKGLSEITEKQEIVNMAQIPKGGNISEVLGKAMAKDAAITIINPDGTKILNFDANLVHPGDTVIETGDGEICVLKTSGIEVEEGMSLEGIYDKIQGNLDKEGVPQEVQDYFNTNRAQGGWLGRINREEAENASEFWKNYGGRVSKLTDEGREKFYQSTNFNNPEEVEKQLTALTGEAREEFKRKIEEDIVGGIEKEVIPELKFFTGHENLDQESYRKVIEGVAKKGLSIEHNNQIILGWSREISVLKNELEKINLTPDQAQERLDRMKDLMETSKNTYGTDVFNPDIRDFVNNYEIQEAPVPPIIKTSVAPGGAETIPPTPGPGREPKVFPEEPAKQPDITKVPKHDFKKFEVSREKTPEGKIIEKVVSEDLQHGLIGSENLNMDEIEKLNLSGLQITGLKANSRIISGYLEKLEKMDPDSAEAQTLKNAIRKTVEMNEKLYKSENLFTPELRKLLEPGPGVPPTPGIEETPPIRPGAEMPKEGVSHPEETPARTEAQAKERVGTEAGTPKDVPHPGETPVVTETEISAGEDIKQLMPEESQLIGNAHDTIAVYFEGTTKPGIYALSPDQRPEIEFQPYKGPIDHLDPALQQEIKTYNESIPVFNEAKDEASRVALAYPERENLRNELLDRSKKIYEMAGKRDTEHLTQEFITNNFSGKQEIRDGFTRIMKKEFKIKDVHSRNSIFNNLIWQNKPIAKYYLTEMNKGTEGQALERIKDYFRLVMERNSSIIKDKDIGDRLKAYVSHYPFYPDAPYETLLEKK